MLQSYSSMDIDQSQLPSITQNTAKEILLSIAFTVLGDDTIAFFSLDNFSNHINFALNLFKVFFAVHYTTQNLNLHSYRILFITLHISILFIAQHILCERPAQIFLEASRKWISSRSNTILHFWGDGGKNWDVCVN